MGFRGVCVCACARKGGGRGGGGGCRQGQGGGIMHLVAAACWLPRQCMACAPPPAVDAVRPPPLVGFIIAHCCVCLLRLCLPACLRACPCLRACAQEPVPGVAAGSAHRRLLRRPPAARRRAPAGPLRTRARSYSPDDATSTSGLGAFPFCPARVTLPCIYHTHPPRRCSYDSCCRWRLLSTCAAVSITAGYAASLGGVASGLGSTRHGPAWPV